MNQAAEHLAQPPVPPMRVPMFGGGWRGEQPIVSRRAIRTATERQSAHGRELGRSKVGSEDPLADLERTYVIEDKEAVTKFLRENPLRGLLLQAVDALNGPFGPEAMKTLALVCDDEGFRALLCIVAMSGGVEEAQRALQVFDEEWWLVHYDRAEGRLNFDVEFA